MDPTRIQVPPAVTQPSCSQFLVEQEVTISVPLVRPMPKFLSLLKIAGARGEVFTKKEICSYLKEYIASHKLYDQQDPRLVYCAGNLLGQVFETEKFTINDVLGLISKHCLSVPDTCIKRKRRLVPWSQVKGDRTGAAVSLLQSCGQKQQVKTGVADSTEQNCLPKATPLKEVPAKKRKRYHGARKYTHSSSSSTSKDVPTQNTKHKTSISVTFSDSETCSYPWYFQVKMEASDESEILSVQDKETILAKDSTDDLWFVEEDAISVEYNSDVFSIQYEVDTTSSDLDMDSDDDNISIISGDRILVLCGDSDVEFWADSSEMDSESDGELRDADKWICLECKEKNQAFERYCNRCWKIRPGWLPEKLSRLNQANESSGTQNKSSNDICPEATSSHSIPSTKNEVDDNICRIFPNSKKLTVHGLQASISNTIKTAIDIEVVSEPHGLTDMTPDDSGISLMSSSVPSSLDIHTDLMDLFTDEVDGTVKKASMSTSPSSAMQDVSSQLAETSSSQENKTHLSTIASSSCNLLPSGDNSKPLKSECSPFESSDNSKAINSHSLFASSYKSKHSVTLNTMKQDSNYTVNNGSEISPLMPCNPQSRENSMRSVVSQGDSSSLSTDSSNGSPEYDISSLVNRQGTRSTPDSDLCIVCLTKSKTGCIIHGQSGHQVCCYKCAVYLKRRGKPCPVCRRPIQKVVRNFIL